MPAICITASNIGSLKDWLAEECPLYRPSHRAEALACGLGFNTHAALLDHLKTDSCMPPLILTLSISDLRQRLESLGGFPPIGALVVDEAFQRRLADPSWLVFDSNINGNSLIYLIAKSLALPMIHFNRRRKYANLEWDYITVDSSGDKAFLGSDADAASSGLFRECQKILRRYPGNERAKIDCSLPVGWVENLTIEAAAAMADMLALCFNQRMRAVELQPKVHLQPTWAI